MVSLPETIKALQVQSDKTVKLIEIPFASQELVKNLPEDQIIIRIRVVGLNPTDWKHSIGPAGTPGTISGCDSAGDVVKVGSAVKHLQVGDRAAGFTHGGSYQTDNGSFAEYVRLVAAVCFKLPESMSYEEAASFPIPHLTAVQALYMRLNLPKPLIPTHPNSNPNQKRESILIWGGSTAVGHHAIQLASLSGLKVFVTASPDVHQDLKSLGAEACFDYKAPDVVTQIQAAAGEEGIIYGYDTVCEKGSTDACVDALSPSRESKLITTRPPTSTTLTRRPTVHVEFALVYTELGFPINLGGPRTLPAMPQDKSAALSYVEEDMPRIIGDWKEGLGSSGGQGGQGSSGFRTQRLRRMEGGLERISEGLEVMRDGRYGREKLVYNVA